MRTVIILFALILAACGDRPHQTAGEQQAPTPSPIDQPQPNAASDTNLSFAKEEPAESAPPPPPVMKKPSGIYQFYLTGEDPQKILHTIAFYPGKFRLQEEFFSTRDSVVVTEGTWAPSRDFIWLYKDQVVRGRYTWQGDTLQYYSPRVKEAFPMQKLQPVTSNDFWQQKKAEGAVLYAIGNEPFWSAEITKQDTLVVNMPDWNTPLRVKVNAGNATPDSTTYTTTNDSLQVIVYPLFCSDGMSDFLYTKKVKMRYKGQTYSGCGERFRSLF